MSWITIAWSMAASACLTLAILHLLIWCRQPDQWAHLLFSTTAISTAAMAAVERMCCNFAVEPKVGVENLEFSSSPRKDRE